MRCVLIFRWITLRQSVSKNCLWKSDVSTCDESKRGYGAAIANILDLEVNDKKLVKSTSMGVGRGGTWLPWMMKFEIFLLHF